MFNNKLWFHIIKLYFSVIEHRLFVLEGNTNYMLHSFSQHLCFVSLHSAHNIFVSFIEHKLMKFVCVINFVCFICNFAVLFPNT